MKTLLEKAAEFADAAHDSIGQKRKYTGLPYKFHPLEVQGEVSRFTDNKTVLIAARFHDILEDVTDLNPYYSADRISADFGEGVLILVKELTNVYTSDKFPNLNRAQRHELEVRRLSSISGDAQTIKLADIFCNTRDLLKEDIKFARIYLPEKMNVIKHFNRGNEELYKQVQNHLTEALAKLGEK